MALSDVTKEAVLKAVEEFRVLGQDTFLEKHGFGKSTRYLLRIDGEDFDSKAIVGAAHGYALPELGPLANSDFSGGKDAAAGVLERLGFQIFQKEVSTKRIWTLDELSPAQQEHYDVAQSFEGEFTRAQFVERYQKMFPVRNPKSFLPSDFSHNNRQQASDLYPSFLETVGDSIYQFVGLDAAHEEKTRNPLWTRDELILATDFYKRHAPQIPGKTDERLIGLAGEIRSYAASLGLRGDETFRNPNGVYMKLMELRKYDPEYQGKGLGHGKPRSIEQEVWDIPRTELEKSAATIRGGLTLGDDRSGVPERDPSQEVSVNDPSPAKATDDLSKMAFENAFKQFELNLLEYNGSSFSGFHSRTIAQLEGYKTEIRKIALRRLQAEEWRIDEIGTGRILSSLIDSIEIRESAELRNNLVAWEARPGQPSLTLQLRQDVGQGNNRQQFERAIFDLFRGRVDHKGSLVRIVELIGRRYSLVAYIFYLVDDSLFMPIAPRTFDRAFATLGFGVRMSGNCSWENYWAYNDAIRKVQKAFVDWKGIPDTRLIDAHSWIWLMVRLPGKIEQLRREGVQKPDDVKFKMIALGRSIISRVAASNGQSEERVVKNKEMFGFTSDQALYAFLNDLWKQQEGRCKLTGLPMALNVPKGKPNDMIVSVDRIDSDAQYSQENLQLTCWFANRWKGTTPNDQFINLLEQVRNGSGGAFGLADFEAEDVILPAPLQR
jgi:hypothetical protein